MTSSSSLLPRAGLSCRLVVASWAASYRMRMARTEGAATPPGEMSRRDGERSCVVEKGRRGRSGGGLRWPRVIFALRHRHCRQTRTLP